jgi:hypothetical protein
MKRHLILAAISITLLIGLFSLLIPRQAEPPSEIVESESPTPRVLASVYDYLYGAGKEKPGYGLYSYVLFPIYSPRAERFLEELFKTTGYARESFISAENLNIMYLPVTSVHDDTPHLPPSPAKFAVQSYNYPMAQKFLTQICSEPAAVVRDICATSLSRGPYVFTYRHPASTLSQVPPPYLFLDLSSVHERAFGEFITAYQAQVKRTDYTDLERIDNLRLHLLSIVLTAADWIDPIKGAIANILHVAEKEDGPGR